MTGYIRRIALIGSLGAAMAGLVAGSAQAAIPTTTSPATGVSATSGVLNGTVATGGAAVRWSFEYGKTNNYGSNTATQQILAGQGSVNVSATVKQLKPNTKYHFRLVTQTGSGSNYYPLVVTFGGDQTFTTKKLGSLSLGGTKFSIKHGAASIGLKCASTQTCKGTLKLIAHIKIGHKRQTLTFGSKSFSIKAGHKQTNKVKLSKTALTLLKKASHHRLSVQLTAKFSTGQPKLNKTVTLIG